MKPKHLHAYAWVLLAAASLLILRCSMSDPNAGNSTQTGNPVLMGMLYQPDGKTPAAGVRVVIRPKKTLADTVGAGLPKRLAAVDSTTTDAEGRFAFDTTLDTGTYVIEAASGNDAVLIDSVQVTSKNSTDSLPPDTLKPMGAIKGVIKLSEGGDPRKVFVLAFGIDRFAHVNADGTFKFASLAEAKYDLRLIAALDNYGVLDTNAVPVLSGDTTDLDTIELPFVGIPTPTGLSATYDTLHGVALLHWNNVNYQNLQGYIIYRNDFAATIPVMISGDRAIADTFFYDTIYYNPLDTHSFIFEYRIKVQDKNAAIGPYYSIPLTLQCPAPVSVKTVLTLDAANVISDTASINDSVKFILRYSNSSRKNVKILWFVNTPDSLAAEKDISSLSGCDTFMYAWPEAGTKNVYLEVQDAAGTIWKDSMNVTIILDPPTANTEGSDTAVGKNDTIHLYGSQSADRFGRIVAFEWNIGAGGNFVGCRNGDTIVIAPDSLFSFRTFVLRVIDDDGLIGLDTQVVSIANLRRINSINLPPRTDHSAVVFKNKIWILGGIGDESIVRNDVWCSTDGNMWELMAGSANPNTHVLDSLGIPYLPGFVPRRGHTSLVFDNKIWVIGGTSYSGVINDVWYSVDGINWVMATSSADFTPRWLHSSVVFDNKMWVISGIGNEARDIRNDIWYSTDGVQWTCATSSTPFPATFAHSSIVFNNKIWVVGGENIGSGIWNSSDGVDWSQVSNQSAFPPRILSSLIDFDNELWLIAGNWNGNQYNDIWRSANGIDWVSAPPPSGFHGREGHRSVNFNNILWIIGGVVEGRYSNEIWYLK